MATKVSFYSGTEGPTHDPYGYDITTVERFGHEFELELHALGESSLSIDDIEVMRGLSDVEVNALIIEFERLTGGDPGMWMRWHERAKSRCACGNRKKFDSKSGYPGEWFTCCAVCGNVMEAHMDWSAII